VIEAFVVIDLILSRKKGLDQVTVVATALGEFLGLCQGSERFGSVVVTDDQVNGRVER
jgi:hypothetical protein